MDIGFKEIAGSLYALFLSGLWYDIRGIRKERIEQNKENDQTFIKKEDHTLVCENTVLKLKKEFSEELQMATRQIIKEIKNNGRR